MRIVGNFDGNHLRCPIEVTKGTMKRALYNVKEDYTQEHNLYQERPDTVERLVGKIREFVNTYNAPPELLKRLGIADKKYA